MSAIPILEQLNIRTLYKSLKEKAGNKAMAHQHPKLDTRERRRSDRSQKGSRVKYILYAALALFSIKILAVLTLKQEIFLGNVPSTEDPQKFQHKPELVEGWGGIMQGIPSAPRSKHDIHVVFSTDCSAYQNYQSIILFNTAEVWRAFVLLLVF